MVAKEVTVKIPSGLEARPIALLVQVASKYDSTIHLEIGNKKVNAKSIMGMMSLTIQEGDTIKVEADGSDEDKAIEDIERYLTGDEAEK